MPYTVGRRTSLGSTAATTSVGSVTVGGTSRLSVPTRTNTATSLSYPSAYSSPSSNRPTTSRYSRFTTGTTSRDSPSSKLRTSRYDNYYSNTSRRSSGLGTTSKYTSPTASTRPYLTVSSGVSTSRESSLSKSWPSPARNYSTGLNTSISRFDPSVRSSSSTVATSIERRRRSPTVVVGGSVPVLPSSSATHLGIESRRGSAHSFDFSLNRTPSSSALHSYAYRRFSGSGIGVLDGNFDAGRAESLYRPSSRYTSSGTNRYLTGVSLLDTAGSISRRGSILSTSSSVGASSMSRSPVQSNSPASKTLWNKHYNSLTARWAEQTGASLSATGKSQYSYRPMATTSTSRRMSNGSDCSVDSTVSKTVSDSLGRRRTERSKKESDGYDTSSDTSSDEMAEAKTKAKSVVKSKRTNGSSGSTVSHRKTKNGSSNGSAVCNGVLNGNGTSSISSVLARRQEERQPSSSDNETAQDSLDARIKARRKRLQKSKVMLQEQKEEGWHYRRTLQIEESKQRQQTSAAATMSYSRGTGKRNGAQPKSDAGAGAGTSTATTAESTGKATRDSMERTPRGTPSRSTAPSALNENSSGVRVTKVYLRPLVKPTWRTDSTATSQSDNGGPSEQNKPSGGGSQQQRGQQNQVENGQGTQLKRNSLSASPAPVAVNVGVKTSLDEEKRDSITNLQRSPLLMRKLSPMNNRALSNERTPPPAPISQRQDFNYTQYVHSIAPKPISYENATAALIEADQEQQSKEMEKPRQGAKEQGKSNQANAGVNGCADQESNGLRTVPLPSMVVVTPVSPPSTKRIVNDTQPAGSLNSVPTPFRRASLSPVRKLAGAAALGQSRSSEKLASASLEYKRRQPSLPPRMNGIDEKCEVNSSVVNGHHRPGESIEKRNSGEDRSGAKVTTVPVAMVPARSVPEKLTPVLTQTFSQPSSSSAGVPNSTVSTSNGFAAKVSKALTIRGRTPPENATTDQLKPVPQKERSAPVCSQRIESRKLSANEYSSALATVKVAEQTLQLELRKLQQREKLRNETLAEACNLPSVDQEMLQLLTLGEELKSSRTSMGTMGSQASVSLSVPAQQSTSKFVQSFRTATVPERGKGTSNLPVPSNQGSRESLNSRNFNTAPKPWTGAGQEGSSESLASSFATAPGGARGSKDSLTMRPQVFNSCPKPWSSKLSGMERLSTSAEPLATLAECPMENGPVAPLRTHVRSSQQRSTNSLELATRKVEEMLRLAKLKHKQQQRREKIILLQSQIQQPRNLAIITQTSPAGGEKASKELDRVYEAIQQDYADAQVSRRHHRQQENHDAMDDSNENVFMKPQLVTVFSTVRLPSPRRAISGDEAIRKRVYQRDEPNNRRIRPDEKIYVRKATDRLQAPIEAPSINDQIDKSKLDYTKRWLEGDLKSLAQESKPDLLQFGSAPQIDFDQRSVGSASAEVAAITNKDRLQSMRAVPDLVPQNQHHRKPQLVKPAPVMPVKQPSMPTHITAGTTLAPISAGQFMGPRVGQTGSKSSSFAGGLPSLQNNINGTKFVQQKAQIYEKPWQRHLQPPKQPQPANLNSGGIQQAIDQLISSAESLPHSDRSWTVPKTVCGQGLVRKQVDMFDRMSDNDSELSFRSADNVAYRSALYKPSKRLSLTDHMATFARRFQSDGENNNGRGGFYRRAPQRRQPDQTDLHSDDEVRLAVLRHSNTKAAQYFQRPLGYVGQAMVTNGSGSTQSLPVTMPGHQKFSSGPNAPGNFQRGPPTMGQRQGIARSGSQEQQRGPPTPQQHEHQQRHLLAPPPWIRGANRVSPSRQQQYWSSNSTLTDVETASGAARHRASRGPRMSSSNENMQAVDNLVAELELNTDCSGSVISQRSTGTFPVDRYYYNNHYHQYYGPVETDRASSSRSKLNAIPEQAEQQNPLDALHAAQRRLEEARRDLKHVSGGGARRHTGQGQVTPVQEKSVQQVPSTLNSSPWQGSLPRSLDGGEKRSVAQPQTAPPPVVQYREHRPSVSGRPASYAAPTGFTVSKPATALAPHGSADRLNVKRASRTEKEEGNYDNIFISGWRQQNSQPQAKAQEPFGPAVPSPRLNSPNVIKIGSVVLGRNTPEQLSPQKSEKQQQLVRNPIKNFFQLFSKGNIGKGPNCEPGREDQRTVYQPTPTKAPSTVSLNARSSMDTAPGSGHWGSSSMTASMIASVSADTGHVHKSCSTNDAYSLKSNITAQEMKQLDELLTSFHDDGGSAMQKEQEKKTGNAKQKIGENATAAGVGSRLEGNQAKPVEKTNPTSNHPQEHRASSRFRLGLPFWKKN